MSFHCDFVTGVKLQRCPSPEINLARGGQMNSCLIGDTLENIPDLEDVPYLSSLVWKMSGLGKLHKVSSSFMMMLFKQN